jgi:hypothetical protein
MAMTMVAHSMAGPSRPAPIAPLVFGIDFSCPSTLAHKPINGQSWPFEVYGPSSHDEDVGESVRRRYLETLLMPDVSCPRLERIRTS